MITVELDEFLAKLDARKRELDLDMPDDVMRNDGSRRTPEKRELLRRAAARAVAAGCEPIKANY